METGIIERKNFKLYLHNYNTYVFVNRVKRILGN